MARKNKKLENFLCESLGKMKKKKRLEVIDELLHCLNFERRIATLTNEEMKHMCSRSLSSAQTKRLDDAPTEVKRKEILMEYARLTYMKDCAWADYLKGITDKKPFSSAKNI